METIKITKTVDEIIGYRANDGKTFKTEEECKKYESSAEFAVKKMFESICVKPDGYDDIYISEYGLWEAYGGGSEDYLTVIVDVKGIDEVKIFNMYSEMVCPKYGAKIGVEHIGKRILVAVGNPWDRSCYVYGTEEEIVEEFKRHMASIFRKKEER